jgi:NTE family protein
MRPRIGLALGGGGARGYAHIGVIRTLQAHGLPIDVVAGTSMGAAVGAVHACGVEMEKFVKILKNLDLNRLLGIPATALRSLESLAGVAASELLFKRADWRHQESERVRQLHQFLMMFSGNKDFSDLKIPFAAVACDVDSGEQIVIRSGKVHTAVAASMALPGIQQPIHHDGRFLIDGGLVNKIPVDVAVELGAQIVIAVDVSAALAGAVQTSVEVLVQAQAILSNELARVKLDIMRGRLGDRLIVIRPAVKQIKLYWLDHLEPAIEAGEQATMEKLEDIRQTLSKYSGASAPATTPRQERPPDALEESALTPAGEISPPTRG